MENPSYINLIGSTPTLKLKNIPALQNFKCKIFVKLENLNPTGSASDRIVSGLIEDAESNGLLHEEVSIICGGSRNLCMSAAWVCSVKGRRCILVPEIKTPKDTILKMEALGATVIKLPYFGMSEMSPRANIKICDTTIKECADMIQPIWVLDPSTTFHSQVMDIHCRTTAEEIKGAVGSQISMIVCGDEGHGMLHGISKKFKDNSDQKPPIIIGVNLENNDFYFPESFKKAEPNLVDEWLESSNGDAYIMNRRIHREEGLLVGPRAGAVLDCAMKAIEKWDLKEKPEATIVVVLNGALWNTDKSFLSIDWMVKNSYYKLTKMESLYWWYDMPVMDIKMEKTVVIDASVQIAKAVEIMIDSNVEKCVVITDDTKAVLGIALRSHLVSALEKGSLRKEDSLQKGTLEKGVTTVEFHADISELEEKMHGNCWAVLTQNVEVFSGDSQEPTTTTRVLGVIDQVDHIVHLHKLEEYHKVNYNIIMTDGIPCETWFTMDYNAPTQE